MKTMKILAIVLLFAIASSAQEKLSLSDAIAIALEKNYDIQIKKADVEMAAINNAWGAAGALPSISFNASSSKTWDYNETADYVNDRRNVGVSLNWLLFDGFAMWIRKGQLDLYEKLSAGNMAVVIENTVQSVILGYYRVLLEREKMRVAERLKKLSRDRFDYESQRRQLGSLTTYELLQAKNSWLEDKARYLSQQVAFKNAIRDLNYLMAVEPERVYEFIDEFAVEPEELDLNAMKEKMLADNSTLKNQYLAQKLLEKDVRLERSQWLPSVSLSGSYNDVSNRMDLSGLPAGDRQDSYNYGATLSLSWSLFNGGNRKRAVEVAEIERQTGEIEIEDAIHALTNQLYNYYEIHSVRKELLVVAQEALETAELNLSISKEKYQTGAINSFNYRDVQLIYSNAAVNRLDAIFNYIDVKTALLRLTGGILSKYGEKK